MLNEGPDSLLVWLMCACMRVVYFVALYTSEGRVLKNIQNSSICSGYVNARGYVS